MHQARLIFSVIFSLVLARGTFGTNDLIVFSGWTDKFLRFGFWTGYQMGVDYPHLISLLIYLVGILTNFLGFRIGGLEFIFLLKIIPIASFTLISIILTELARRNGVNNRTLAAAFLLNPAVLINGAILGYLDGPYLLFIILVLTAFDQLLQKKIKKHHLIWIWLCALLGIFLKWQYLISFVSLFSILIWFSLRFQLLRYFLWGGLLASVVAFFPAIFGVNSLEPLHKILAVPYVVANASNIWQLFGFFSFPHFPGYWQNATVFLDGRYLFYVVLSLILYFCFRAVKTKIAEGKIDYLKLILGLLMWSNLVYFLFSTGVHENHLMALVVVSAFLFFRFPTRGRLWIYLFFSVVEFTNLFYLYSFGRTGLFGWTPHFFNFGSMPLSLTAILLLLIFAIKLRRLVSCPDELLGWS